MLLNIVERKKASARNNIDEGDFAMRQELREEHIQKTVELSKKAFYKGLSFWKGEC